MAADDLAHLHREMVDHELAAFRGLQAKVLAALASNGVSMEDRTPEDFEAALLGVMHDDPELVRRVGDYVRFRKGGDAK